MFSVFINHLQQSLNKKLPGEQAQFLMSPKGRRLKADALQENPNPKLSAVLVLFYPVNDEIYTLLMLRNAYDGVHSSQVSFPGGQWTEQDKSLKNTAIREANEEIGIESSTITIIGQLTELYIEPSKFLVQPFVGYTEFRPDFITDKREVDKLIELPIVLLLDDKIVKEKAIHVRKSKKKIIAPYYDIFGHIVWGATAMMLSELKEVIKKF